jgi:hypothetical protein
MAHEGRERLGVDACGNHEGGVGVACLVQSQALGQTGLDPSAVGAAIEARGMERRAATVGEDELIVGDLSPARETASGRSGKP